MFKKIVLSFSVLMTFSLPSFSQEKIIFLDDEKMNSETRITLENGKMRISEIEKLDRTLRTNTNITDLTIVDVSYIFDSYDEGGKFNEKRFGNFLKTNNYLTSLTLERVGLSYDHRIQPFCSFLMENKSIRYLSIKNNIMRKRAEYLSGVIESSKTLEIIDFSDNELPFETAQILINAAKKSSSLTEIRIDAKSIIGTDTMDYKISEHGKPVSTFEKLKVTGPIGGEAVRDLIKSGKINDTITYLDLSKSENKTSRDDLNGLWKTELVNQLNNKSYLIQLNLSGNEGNCPFTHGKRGSHCWIESLITNNRTIQDLDISDCTGCKDHFFKIVEALKSNNKLLSLKVDGIDGARELLIQNKLGYLLISRPNPRLFGFLKETKVSDLFFHYK